MRGSIPVAVSPQRAWELFSRVEDWPRWDWMGLADACWLEGEPWREGSLLRLGHHPFTFDCRLTRSAPPQTVTWEGGGVGIQGLHTYRFEPHPRGCLVVSTETFTGSGARAIKPLVRWYWGRHLHAFRRFAEAHR